MLDQKDFFMLPPVAIAAGNVTSGPPDAENDVYSAGATYAAGDRVWYTGNVWQSLVGGNIGNTPVEGANWTDRGEVDAGALAYNAGTTYAEDDYAIYQGALWRSTLGSNIGNTPSVTDPNWTRQGATNRFKAFDTFLQDSAMSVGSLSWTIEVVPLVTHIAIFRPVGSTVQITMTDAIDGVVYDETFALIDDSAITDWWAYFFEEIISADTVIAEDLPPYAGAEISVNIQAGPASNVAAGQIVIGRALSFGTVKTGSSVGIESYSIKDRDDFNRSIVVPRPFSDTVVFDLAIDTLSVGYVKRRLAEREALPTVYFMAGGSPYGAAAYGFFQTFDILHSTHVIADCVLEIEGLG